VIKQRWQDATVFVSGAGLVLSFSPFGLFPLAIIFPALLFYFWSMAEPRRAAWLGFLFGLGLFGAGASWVYVSIHEFGFMPAPLAAVLVFIFVAILSLFPASAGWLQSRFLRPSYYRLIFVIPVLWVFAEWFRGWVFSGFPWLHLGYSQSNSILMNFAPLVGVYGMSLVVAILSVSLGVIVRYKSKHRFRAATLFVVILAAAWSSGKLNFVQEAGETVDVALVQGNVSLKDKWRPGSSTKIIKHYAELSRRAVNESSIIIWPEGAIPGNWKRALTVLKNSLPRRQDGRLPDYLIGAIDISANKEYYNAAIPLSDQSLSPGPNEIYRKKHLVPFGEYLLFKPVFGWVVKYLEIPMSDFTSWQGAQPDISLAGWPVAVSICYEDAFGEELAPSAANAAFLINLSEDAWFGDSLAPHQRLQMAQVRARETGRYFIRAANTGFTTVINDKGEITSILEQFVPGVLQAEVQPMKGLTPFVRYGNGLFLFLLGLWLLPALFVRFIKDEV